MHPVGEKRFVLIAADHPIISAVRAHTHTPVPWTDPTDQTVVLTFAHVCPCADIGECREAANRRNQHDVRTHARARATADSSKNVLPRSLCTLAHHRPEGLVKISSSLFEHILPLVKGQVETQIKVRDMSNAQVSVKPADYSSWSEARNELIVDAKRPLKAALAAELSAQPDHDKHHTIRAKYEALEANLEHDIDYKPMRLDMEVEMEYNFLG